MKTAIIGLPMTGKTSLFTILTGVHQETRIGSTAVRTGVTKVPDPRLDELAKIFEPPKITHAIGGVCRHAVDLQGDTCAIPAISPACAWSTRSLTCCASSDDETVPHEKGSVDPVRDLEDVETELILSDLVVVEKRLERLDKDRKKIKNPELDHEFELLEKCKAQLEANQPLRNLTLDADEEKRVRGFQFLSQKPMLFVLNLGESDASAAARARGRVSQGPARRARHTPTPPRSAARWKPSWRNCRRRKRASTWPSYGLQESGLVRLISATYRLQGLMSLSDGRRDRGPRLDRPHRQHRAEGRRRHPFRFREEVHPRRSGELEKPGGSRRLSGRPREGTAAARGQRVHRQGRRRAGHPPLMRGTCDLFRDAGFFRAQ